MSKVFFKVSVSLDGFLVPLSQHEEPGFTTPFRSSETSLPNKLDESLVAFYSQQEELGFSTNPLPIREVSLLMDEIDAANFTRHFHRLGSRFFLRLGKE